MTTFVRSVGSRTKSVWQFLDKASRVNIRLVELEHPSLKKITSFARWVPVHVHSSFYRALKLKYPLDVGDVSRDSRVTTELGTGSLKYAAGILTPEDFRAVVDSE